MLSCAKTFPCDWPAHRNLRETLNISNIFTKYLNLISGRSPNQWRSPLILTSSDLQSSPPKRPLWPKTTETMALQRHTEPKHHQRNHPLQTPWSISTSLHCAPVLIPETPPAYQVWQTTPRSASRHTKTRSLVSTRIGCTKILEIILITESTRMVSGKIG